MNFAFPADHKNEIERKLKIAKYMNLARELDNSEIMKVIVKPVIVR